MYCNTDLIHRYDVNVTPDKRTILLHDEAKLVELVKDYFVKMFQPTQYTYNVLPVDSFMQKPVRAHTDLALPASHSRNTPLNEEKEEQVRGLAYHSFEV